MCVYVCEYNKKCIQFLEKKLYKCNIYIYKLMYMHIYTFRIYMHIYIYTLMYIYTHVIIFCHFLFLLNSTIRTALPLL